MPHIYLFLNFYRYLLQLFLEGSCLGWAAVVATVLRDAAAMARTVRTAHAPMQTFDSIINLRDGLLTLTKWSQSEWYAYIIIFNLYSYRLSQYIQHEQYIHIQQFLRCLELIT